MKKLITILILIALASASYGQLLAPKGIKIGNYRAVGTSIITIDSVTQYSTGDFKLWKGATQLSPNLPLGFKIGAVAVPSTLTATELGYVDGVTSAIQTQFTGKVSTATTVNGHALTGNISVTTTDLSLQNVTNESKTTMFTSPTLTGTPVIPTPFTIGAVSMTATAANLNKLAGFTATVASTQNINDSLDLYLAGPPAPTGTKFLKHGGVFLKHGNKLMRN